MQMESGVLYFCPPIDGKKAHLAYEKLNKVNYFPEVHGGTRNHLDILAIFQIWCMHY